MTRFPVLMYHAVTPLTGRQRQMGVAPDLLAGQLRRLQDEGYVLLGLTEALRLAERDPATKVVALTFDDAYADFLHAALPVLQELNARATVYVPTAYVGGTADWLGSSANDVPRLLSWPELRLCVSAGNVEIGSHSSSHRHLDSLPDDALDSELAGSRQSLEDELEVRVASLSYPHGYHSRMVRRAVETAGYDNACEVGRRLRDAGHRLCISRLAVGPSDSPQRLVRHIQHGGPLIVPTAKRTLRPAWRRVRRYAGSDEPPHVASTRPPSR